MKKVMKVIIDGKIIIVSDFFRKDAIKDILIFGGSGREVEEEVVLSNLDNTKKTYPRRKGKAVLREKVIWTLDEVTRLKELALQGTPTSAMAVIFRKKYYNISNKLRSLGILDEYKKIRTARAGRNNEGRNIASFKELASSENSEAKEERIEDNPSNQRYL